MPVRELLDDERTAQRLADGSSQVVLEAFDVQFLAVPDRAGLIDREAHRRTSWSRLVHDASP